MKLSLVLLSLLAFAAPAFPDRHHKRGSHPELCELKTVFVDGNSESANMIHNEIAERTWLKLVASKEHADAVLAIAETKSTRGFPMTTEQTTVSGQLVKPDSDEILWSDSASFGEGVFNSGAGSASKMLLGRLTTDANCKE
jgi:hypothetical protein